MQKGPRMSIHGPFLCVGNGCRAAPNCADQDQKKAVDEKVAHGLRYALHQRITSQKRVMVDIS